MYYNRLSYRFMSRVLGGLDCKEIKCLRNRLNEPSLEGVDELEYDYPTRD